MRTPEIIKEACVKKMEGLPEKVAERRKFMRTPEIIKEALFAKIAERGQGIGQGGARQLDLGADKCKCPKCGHVANHDRGTPCSEISCPECGTKMGGV